MNEQAKKRALNILEKRDVSRKMLLDKLTERDIPLSDAQEVADWLCSLGVVDDRRFAQLVVRHYAGKGYGERRVCEELRRHGIDRELWDEALEEMPEQEETLERFVRTRLRGAAPEGDALRRVSAAAVRRGYSWEDIRRAVERLKAEEDMS